MRKVYVDSNQYNLLVESEWNYHFGSGNHDKRPYVSDNKFMMFGRETGHFGSGTYFSTYKDKMELRGDIGDGYHNSVTNDRRDMVNDYENNARSFNPQFIQVGKGIYRVDFDIYRNLYRVRSKRQGDILYTMMRCLNAMYNRICSLGKFNPSDAIYSNASLYQKIRKNALALGLRCPSYYELTRMAQVHGSDDDAIQSFSTLFMEWNGYNGVNVSGVEYYDSTKHGSVIYDLSKVSDDFEEIEPRSLFIGYRNHPYDDTVVYDDYDDAVCDSLKGEYPSWHDKLNDMPISNAMRLLKNYMDSGHLLDMFLLRDLDDELVKRYLRLIFVRNPRNHWGDFLIDNILGNYGNDCRYLIELINRVGAYYWINYKCSGNSVLVELLSSYVTSIPWDVSSSDEERLKREYYDKLMSYMERDLTSYEDKYIRENYFG